jgi:hypothetical protein
VAKSKISDRIVVSAHVQIRIARTGKLSGNEYQTIAKFQEALPPLIDEVQRKTALTFLELLQEFHDRERARRSQLPSNEKIVKGDSVKVRFSNNKGGKSGKSKK